MTVADAAEPPARADPVENRGQRRARERAERAEWDHLIARIGVLCPNYDCSCGSLEDLRRTVADLERTAGPGRAGRPRRRRAHRTIALTMGWPRGPRPRGRSTSSARPASATPPTTSYVTSSSCAGRAADHVHEHDADAD